MSYKLKRMKKVGKTYGDKLDAINESTHQLYEKFGENADWQNVECKEMDVFLENVGFMIEELRDDYVVSDKTAEKYLWDALRLRERGKI